MKTLVVLSAFAAIAIAAPSLFPNRNVEYGPESYHTIPTLLREKKSGTEINNSAAQLSAAQQFLRKKINHVRDVSGGLTVRRYQ